ncbi:MAG: NUDIX hydrolase [bacterium]
MEKKKTKFELSAGGVIYKKDGEKILVCLVATKGGETWQLPKGLVQPGEPMEEAAAREVREETGLSGEIVRRIDKVDYWFYWGEGEERTRHHKLVYFYLLKFSGGSVEDHDYEVSEARWFPIEEAEGALSYENEREILRKAREIIQSEISPPRRGR